MVDKRYNILIVDDNLDCAKRCINVLYSEFVNDANIPYNIKNSKINILSSQEWPKRGEEIDFIVSDRCFLSYYYYNVDLDLEKNKQNILRIITQKKINILWFDNGYYDLYKKGAKKEKVHKSSQNNNINALEILLSEDICSAVLENNYLQVAVYTFNLLITEFDIEVKRNQLISKYCKLPAENNKIFVFDTSSTFTLYESSDISDGNRKDGFMGDVDAFEKYGEILGHILFDLFYQQLDLQQNIQLEDHYNYFYKSSNSVLSYSKLLNKLIIPEKLLRKLRYKIGLISFDTIVDGKPEFLIDIPYKHYYKLYDEIVETNGILSNILNNRTNKEFFSSVYIEYNYFHKSGKYHFEYYLERNGIETKVSDEEIIRFLPFLHSAIFYVSGFYQIKKIEDYNSGLFSYQQIKQNKGKIRIHYLFVNTQFTKYKGVLHLAFFRKYSNRRIQNIFSELKSNAFEKESELLFSYYYPLIAPKVEDTLIPILEKQIQKNALSATISQIMSRNTSHNLGSHVLYRSTNLKVKERLESLYDKEAVKSVGFNEFLDVISEKLDKFEIHRNEYISDFDLPAKSMYFFKDIILPFCENTLILDSICNSEDISYSNGEFNKLKIRCLINGKQIDAFYPSLKGYNGETIKVSYPEAFPYFLERKNSDELKNEPNSSLEVIAKTLKDALANKKIAGNDSEVCIHNEHAIYSILENIVRNSSKHNYRKLTQNQNLEITLELLDDEDPDFYKLMIYDNVSVMNGKGLWSNNIDNPGLYEKIHTSILSDGKIRRANWGFADMKINSFLLLNKANEIDEKRLNSNLKIIFKSRYSESNFITLDKREQINDIEEYSFGYQLRLCKPRKILWFGKLPKSNWDFSPVFKQFERLEDYYDNRSAGIASFEFVVFNNGVNSEELLEIIANLPRRIFIVGAESSEKLHPNIIYIENNLFNNIDNLNDLCKLLFVKWIGRLNKKIQAYLYFGEESLLDNWKIVPAKFNSIDSKTISFDIADLLAEEHRFEFNNHYIFYDRHNNVFDTELRGSKQAFDPKIVEQINFFSENTHIPFDKGSDDFNSLLNIPADEERQIEHILRLTDAATTNIFILDERILKEANKLCAISDFAKRGKNTKIDDVMDINWRMYASGNVFVVNKINGELIDNSYSSPYSFELKTKNGTLEFSTNLDDVFEECDKLRKDVLIIHRTFLNKEKLQMENKSFFEIASKLFGAVYVTSGGGFPHNLERKCKFIPFSILENCVNSRLSKIKLLTNLY